MPAARKKQYRYGKQFRRRPAKFTEVQVREFSGGVYGFRSRTFVVKGEFEFVQHFLAYVLREYLAAEQKGKK